MSLTAGATLQNGKYLIQTVLHQTDASVSYRATHTSLNQPVVIYTLNPALRQSSRFDSLRQQFLATVKQGDIQPAIVRDCFEENEMPYAVLEPTPAPIKLTDWMPFLTAAVLAPSAANGHSAPPIVAPTPIGGKAIAPPQALPQLPSPQLPSLPTVANSPQSPPAVDSQLPTAQPQNRWKRWIPVALLLTACTGGLAGAAIGWKLRQGAVTPNAPALFSREQPFPEKTDWLGEDPYAESESDDDAIDSASPAIERRSVTPRRRAIEPEPEYNEPEYSEPNYSESRPRWRSRRSDRSAPEQRDFQSDRESQAEEKPEVEAPPKVESFPDPALEREAPPAPVPAAPEAPPPAPVEIPSPKTQLAPPAPPDEPISQ